MAASHLTLGVLRRAALLALAHLAIACANEPSPRRADAPRMVATRQAPVVTEPDESLDLGLDLRLALWVPERFAGTIQQCALDGLHADPTAIGTCTTRSVQRPRLTAVDVPVELTGIEELGIALPTEARPDPYARCLRWASLRIDGARDGRLLAHVVELHDGRCLAGPEGPAHSTRVPSSELGVTRDPPPADFGALAEGVDAVCWVAAVASVTREADELVAQVDCAHGRARASVRVRAPVERAREIARLLPTVKARLRMRSACGADLVEVLDAPWANESWRQLPESTEPTDPLEGLADL